MSRNHKLIAAVVMLVLGTGLIAWNLRDPDAAFREPPLVTKPITALEAPAAVREVIKRVSAGGKLHEIKQETRGDQVKYEVEVLRGNTKAEYKIAPDGTIMKQKSKKLKAA